MIIIKLCCLCVVAVFLRSKWAFGRLLFYLLYCFMWNVFSIIDSTLLGVRLHRKNIGYRRRILLRMKPRPIDLLDNSYPLDFLCLGGTSINCDYILSDNVTLYCMCGDMVVFVESPKDMDIYNSELHPFLLETQFYKATHVIIMSLSNACSLADELGNPKEKTICLVHTGRAGSTLMAQMLYKTGKVRVLSMPDCYRSLLTSQDALPMDVKGKYTLVMTQLLCKPIRRYKECCTILIKIKSNEILMIPLLQKYVGWVKNIGMYRNGLTSVLSMERLLLLTDWRLVFEYNWLKHLYFALNMYPYYGQFSTNDVDSNFLLLTWRHLSIVTHMMEFKKKYNMYTIKFEDLIASPDEVIRDVFITCGLSSDLVQHAKTALNQHSQKNSMLLGGASLYNTTVFGGELKLKSELICKNFKLPLLDADFRL